MLQNPRVAFRDPNLQTCRFEKDHRNQPRPWAGSFAVVFKAYSAERGEPFAVRVFTTESPERRERYHLVSSYLAARKPACLVEFEYRDQSIRSAGDGKWYPLILMEWVQGETLFHWLRTRAARGDAAAIAQAADRWLELVRELAAAGVAHGDLQHANVMVTDSGELKLVDYDCMCVPALVGRRNLEIGVVPYQHPDRDERTLLSLDLDNFSALVIYVALRALAVEPGLWRKYVEEPRHDRLLFRREDFVAPNASALYHDLMRLPDEDLRTLCGQLFGLYHVRMDRVPSLGAIVNSYAKIEALLRGQRWAEAVALLNRRGQFRDAPESLKPLIHRAYEEVCRQQAWQALERIGPEINEQNDRALAQAWNEALLAGFEPAERQRVRVADARRRVEQLNRLYHLVQQASGQVTLEGEQSIVDAAAALPQGYRHSLGPRIELARRRAGAVGRLRRAIHDATSEAAIVAAWRAVCEAGCEGLVGAEPRARIEQAERRAPLLRRLDDLPAELPMHERDRRLVELWDDALLGDCPEAARWRAEYEKALGRREALARLGEAITLGADGPILDAASDARLADFVLPTPWAERVAEARRCAQQSAAMAAALAEGRFDAVAQQFDARAVRQDSERFAPYAASLAEWARRELVDPEAIGLGPPDAGEPIEASDDGTVYVVRWSFPSARYAERCILGVAPAAPPDDAPPDEVALNVRYEIDRTGWEAAGRQHVIAAEPEWRGHPVAVWAVIDLGFETFISRPLILGRLRPRRRWSWPKWSLFASSRPSAQGGEAAAAPSPPSAAPRRE